eukprot:9266421-Pyramimonas_sp.AAC.1
MTVSSAAVTTLVGSGDTGSVPGVSVPPTGVAGAALAYGAAVPAGTWPACAVLSSPACAMHCCITAIWADNAVSVSSMV